MVDFHTHILPGLDDGSESVKETLEMLGFMRENGVNTVLATPHYYREKCNLECFLECREKAFSRVLAEAEKRKIDIPEIILGSEVAYFPGISRFEQIDRLCIGSTRYVLLEMPFERWDSFVIAELEGLIASQGIIPIIAHVERYHGYKRYMPELVRLQLPIQVNANSLLKTYTSSYLMKCIRSGTIQLIGSDCHNMYSRPPNIHLALQKVEKKLGADYVRRLGRVWNLMLNRVRRE